MFDTAYMVDEILFLLAMDWAYEVLVQVYVLRPMLSLISLLSVIGSITRRPAQ
jgi:hypothetical protein